MSEFSGTIARAKEAYAMTRPESTWAVQGCTEMHDVLPELIDEAENSHATLFLIQEARIDYEAALRHREHGGVAASRFMASVFRALDGAVSS